MSRIVIIALKYLEPEYEQTVKCIEETGLPVIWADRDGVGNYSRAFNEAFKKGAEEYDYAWMISNITFDKEVPERLGRVLDENPTIAAVHPSMAGSDHQHQWPDKNKSVEAVPFIEWTAPMVRVSVFEQLPLNNKLEYYYMDLSWSYEVQKIGYSVAVDYKSLICHTYLRNKKGPPNPISEIRKTLRRFWIPEGQKEMIRLYGPNWQQIMNWKK